MSGIGMASTAERRPGTSRPVRVLAAIAGLVLVGFIAVEGAQLFSDYHALRQELANSHLNAVVGYQDISPMPSYATKPLNWVHEDGDHTMLWAGWTNGAHSWFQIRRGDLVMDQITHTWASDAVRAIDYPIFEQGGGDRWSKIPEEAQVAGLVHRGIDAVYPIDVLRKVEVVNDLFDEVPLLVLFTPFVVDDQAVTVFEATLAGQRITMGLTGYFLEGRQLLYDRGSRSLWTARAEALACVAGPKKGASLKLVSRLLPVAWAQWRADHPASRLVVGADRSRGKPNL